MLIQYDYTDTYRFHNFSRQEFTCITPFGAGIFAKSRIDQIWISPATLWQSRDAYIKTDISQLIKSDHRMMIMELETWQIDKPKQPRLHKIHHTFNWTSTTEEEWGFFSSQIESQIKEDPRFKQTLTLDRQWNLFKQIVLQAAHDNIRRRKAKHRRNIFQELATANDIVSLHLFLSSIKNAIRNPKVFLPLEVIKKKKQLPKEYQDLSTALSTLQ